MATLLEALIQLKTKGPVRKDAGICWNIDLGIRSWFDKEKIKQAFTTWPHFSGNSSYPIPSTHYPDPSYAYDRTDNLWDRRTKYGRLRWDLLDHLIEYLEKHDGQHHPADEPQAEQPD